MDNSDILEIIDFLETTIRDIPYEQIVNLFSERYTQAQIKRAWDYVVNCYGAQQELKMA